MTARRITIARDGTVKLRGKATRWICQRSDYCRWVVRTSTEHRDVFGSTPEARAYLESLTDEELMG